MNQLIQRQPKKATEMTENVSELLLKRQHFNNNFFSFISDCGGKKCVNLSNIPFLNLEPEKKHEALRATFLDYICFHRVAQTAAVMSS